MTEFLATYGDTILCALLLCYTIQVKRSMHAAKSDSDAKVHELYALHFVNENRIVALLNRIAALEAAERARKELTK